MGYTVFTKLKATGDFAVGGSSIFTGDLTVGGNGAVTGALTVAGSLTAPGIVKLTELGSITFDAVSGEAEELFTLPEGAVLIKAYCTVTEAFNSGDSDVLILGTESSEDALLAAADITETTEGTYQKDAWMVGAKDGTAISAKLTKTGTDATEGGATFYALICCPAES